MKTAFWNRLKPKFLDKDDTVKIIEKKPPVYKSICVALNIKPQGVLYTYDGAIYNPDKADIPAELIEHEKIHIKQQKANGMTPDLWWGKWLRDPKFRLDQEAKGYARQYDEVCKIITDRNRRARYLWDLAMSLCGPLYGEEIDHQGAMKLIKSFAKNK